MGLPKDQLQLPKDQLQLPKDQLQWWGPVNVAHGQCSCWEIGPLTLWVQRLVGEWRIARVSDSDATLARVSQRDEVEVADLLEHKTLSRFGVGGEEEELEIVPALADRAVVCLPQRPFYIPAGEEVTVYLGTPLWLRLLAGSKGTPLDAFPIHQPADTWFGPDSKQGELCYASRSFCRLQLDALHRRPHRGSTALVVRNQASSALYLEQIKLPVPYLSLYHDTSNGDLWTNDVVLEREDGKEFNPLRITQGPPSSVKDAVEIAGPREHLDGNIMLRAFESLFSERDGG